MRLEPDISKTAGDRDSVPISKVLPTGNALWGIEWSCDRCGHVTDVVTDPKGQTRDPNTL